MSSFIKDRNDWLKIAFLLWALVQLYGILIAPSASFGGPPSTVKVQESKYRERLYFWDIEMRYTATAWIVVLGASPLIKLVKRRRQRPSKAPTA